MLLLLIIVFAFRQHVDWLCLLSQTRGIQKNRNPFENVNGIRVFVLLKIFPRIVYRCSLGLSARHPHRATIATTGFTGEVKWNGCHCHRYGFLFTSYIFARIPPSTDVNPSITSSRTITIKTVRVFVPSKTIYDLRTIVYC